MPNLVKRHGVMVVAGKIATNAFAKGFNTLESMNAHFEGSWSNLEALVKAHFADHEPGTGSVDGDVLLVNVPADKFFMCIAKVDESNRDQVFEIDHVRAEGEAPVRLRVMKGKKLPATFVQVVVYRADVLDRDDDRSTNAEWEIVAINAQPDRVTPMHPTTMRRNAEHAVGGTMRSYTDQEWQETEDYWRDHAFIVSE